MNLPTSPPTEVSVSELLLQIQNLLEKVEMQAVQIEKLIAENTRLHAEMRHLKQLKGQRRSHVLNPVANAYMKQVMMAAKWVDVLSSFDDVHFLNEASRVAFLDD